MIFLIVPEIESCPADEKRLVSSNHNYWKIQLQKSLFYEYICRVIFAIITSLFPFPFLLYNQKHEQREAAGNGGMAARQCDP